MKDTRRRGLRKLDTCSSRADPVQRQHFLIFRRSKLFEVFELFELLFAVPKNVFSCQYLCFVCSFSAMVDL